MLCIPGTDTVEDLSLPMHAASLSQGEAVGCSRNSPCSPEPSSPGSACRMLASPVTLTNCATRSASNTSSVSKVCLNNKLSSYCPADEALQAGSISFMGKMHADASSGMNLVHCGRTRLSELCSRRRSYMSGMRSSRVWGHSGHRRSFRYGRGTSASAYSGFGTPVRPRAVFRH